MAQLSPPMQSQEFTFAPSWLSSLEAWQQHLIVLSHQLYEREVTNASLLSDYSFIVFPMSKAYEGFLKRYLFDAGLINRQVYESRRFRIGRALNPDVANGQQDELWLFDDISRLCGKDVAKELWTVWLTCRNHVFHYFPGQENNLSLDQARRYIDIIEAAIQAALTCQVLQQTHN